MVKQMLKGSDMLHDETGSHSTARTMFVGFLLLCMVLLVFEAFGVTSLQQLHFAFMGGVVTALAAWAGGPRVAKYIGPQIGKFAQSVAQAKGEPNPFDDDERDEVRA